MNMNRQYAVVVKGLTFIILVAIVVPFAAHSRTAKPAITITQVPQFDEKGGPERLGTIKGKVQGADDCKDCKVVLFAYTNTWWVQPVADSPDTAVVNGKFESETHLGTAYAAMLVRSTYRAPATIARLPNVGGDILAIDRKTGER